MTRNASSPSTWVSYPPADSTPVDSSPMPALVSSDPLIPTLFHEPWWLDIATGGRYDVAEVVDGGKIVGRLPYYTQKMFGLSIVTLPPLTHFLGPAVTDCHGKPNTQFLRRLDITNRLIGQIPDVSSFYVKCHRDVTDVLAFQGAGFRAGVQFTHEIHPQPIEIVWKSLRDKARNHIGAARKKYSVTAGTDPDLFMQFYAWCVEKSKEESNHKDVHIHTELIRACLERGRGKIYEARERDGRLAAAIFCAWDNVSSYYLMTSRAPAAHGSSTSLLVWEAISDAVERNLIFDFDGIVSEGGARSANHFAPTLAPRYTAIRDSASTQILRAVKAVVKRPNFYY